ncbi:MAG: hypothetical protein LYZ69_06055 [Nitrososphaerales archaeon]|nr:hypothetical protein [Nitrososphaerales archaeon]
MNAVTKAVWLGHCRTGGRLCLKPDELLPGVNVIGNGADEVSSVISFACSEVGLRTLVLDFGGSIAEKAAGRLDVRGVGHFLYDSMRLEESASLHAELAASAYTMSLNLSFEQEGFLNSAMQLIGLEQGVATPASLIDRLGGAGEYRGHTADELKGKLGALRSLDVTGESGAVREMMGKSSVASFAGAESRQAAEVALMLFIAKVLALGASGEKLPDVIVVNDANRVFSNLPLTRHGNRLLTALLASEMARMFASEDTYGLDHHFIETAPVRILSSGLWNEVGGGRASVGGLYSPQHAAQKKGSAIPSALILTPNMFVLQDSARGYEEVFVPRYFPPLQAEAVVEVRPAKDENHLIKQILEAVSSYDSATRGSVVSYLSLDNPKEEIEKAIDRLQAQGYLTVAGKDVKRDGPLVSVKLTETGYKLLGSLG